MTNHCLYPARSQTPGKSEGVPWGVSHSITPSNLNEGPLSLPNTRSLVGAENHLCTSRDTETVFRRMATSDYAAESCYRPPDRARTARMQSLTHFSYHYHLHASVNVLFPQLSNSNTSAYWQRCNYQALEDPNEATRPHNTLNVELPYTR